MPRRALRKIHTLLDLSRHLRTWDELPQPWDPVALFGREAPLEVEVGSGKGLFLVTAAVQRPDVNFLGIEIAAKYAEYCAARLAKHETAAGPILNAVVANCDAGRVMAELLPDASLSAVHVYFPDPWWKLRHRKRRVMNEPFARHVERTLRPGGALHFWTDVEEYFRTTLALLSRATGLLGPLAVPEHQPEHDFDYRTHFERRVRRENQIVHRAEFRKAE